MLLGNGNADGKDVCCAGAPPGASWAAGGIGFPPAHLDLIPTCPSSSCSGPVLEPQLWLLGLLALVQAADEIVISSVRELGNTWLLFQIRVSQVSNCSLKYKALAWKLQVSGTPFFDLYCLIQGCGSTADNLSVLPFSSTVLVSSWHRVV